MRLQMDDTKRAAIENEIRKRFDAYEKALTGNDVDALLDFFWDDPKSVRLTAEGGAWGYEAIANFRKGRPAEDLMRELLRTEINVLSDCIGVANAEYRRTGSGRRGAQSQVWQKRGDTWRIISAHVSLGPAP